MRPKTVVMHEGREHIAKFSCTDDLFNVPLAEYATLQLAMHAGIRVPDFELIDLGDRPVLLVERFDRSAGGKRLHYLSARSLINIPVVSADGREFRTGFSYAGIAESMRPINPEAVADSQDIHNHLWEEFAGAFELLMWIQKAVVETLIDKGAPINQRGQTDCDPLIGEWQSGTPMHAVTRSCCQNHVGIVMKKRSVPCVCTAYACGRGLLWFWRAQQGRLRTP